MADPIQQASERVQQILTDLRPALEREQARARRQQTEQLNQAARRMRQAADLAAWAQALLDGATDYCSGAVLLQVTNRGLERFAGGSNVGVLPATGAFASVLESQETVVTLRTERDLPAALLALYPESGAQKAYLFPLLRQGKIAAVLYAEGDGESVDATALELLSTIAAVTLENRAVPKAETVQIAAAPAVSAPLSRRWADLTVEERDLHLKAQRFAQTEVARLLLDQSVKVARGRQQRDLWAALASEIETVRKAFRQKFMQASPTMVDYYHLELVRTLAQHDPVLLGIGYPGPLVA